jgi:proline iminopeptidase
MHPALTPGAHAITVDSIVQRYHVHGAGPVCVVHPGGPGVNWDHLRLPGLEGSNTMVYVEPIGTGESGRLPETDLYTLARYATHLRAIVAVVGGRDTALLGHAHGGSVLQQYITTYPDSVRALVLVCSTPVLNDELIQEAEDSLSRFAEQHADRSEAADVTAAYLDVLTATDDHTLTYALRRLFPANFRDYWAPGSYASLFKLRSNLTAWVDPWNGGGYQRTDFRDALGRVRTPALIISGAWDPIISPRWSRALEVSLPGSRLVEFPDSAHLPHLEEPDSFNRIVAEFLLR